MKFRLNHLFLLSFFIIFLVVVFSLYYQYKFSKDILVQNFINKHYVYTLKLKDEFKNILSKIQYIFDSHLEDNLKKLDILQLLYNKNFNAKKIANILNKDRQPFFYYEVFLINKNYKIVDASYTPDLGLDLGAFKVYKEILKSVFEGKKKIDINYSPHLDISSMNLKQYFLIRSPDKKYLLQLAFVVDLYSYFKQIYKKAFEKMDLKKLDIYFVEKYHIYKFDFNKRYHKKLPFNVVLANSKKYILQIANKLGVNQVVIDNYLKSKDKYFIANLLEYIFSLERNRLIKVDFNNKVLINYALVKGILTKSKNMLIIKAEYSLDELIENINALFKRFMLIALFLFIFIILIYYFFVVNLSKDINILINSIKQNKKAKINTFIEEIEELFNIYNEFRYKLNSEIEKNKQLLQENKKFIVDTIHQIKTPLSIITLNIDYIKSYELDEISKETLEEIEAAVTMLTNSYEDLSYLSGNGIVKYDAKEKINLSEFLKERLQFFNSLAKANHKKIVSKIDKDIFYKINKIEIERIVDNNLTNAIKYSTKPEIFVSLIKKDKKAILSFATYGEKILNPFSVFEKNYREHSHKRGLGIGLNIVKEICEKYNIKYIVKYKNGKNIFEYVFKI